MRDAAPGKRELLDRDFLEHLGAGRIDQTLDPGVAGGAVGLGTEHLGVDGTKICSLASRSEKKTGLRPRSFECSGASIFSGNGQEIALSISGTGC